MSDETITFTNDTTVKSLTVPAGASYCVAQVIGEKNLRWRFDTNPTTSVGHFLVKEQSDSVGGREYFYMDQMKSAKFICDDSSGTTLFVTYYQH